MGGYVWRALLRLHRRPMALRVGRRVLPLIQATYELQRGISISAGLLVAHALIWYVAMLVIPPPVNPFLGVALFAADESRGQDWSPPNLVFSRGGSLA